MRDKLDYLVAQFDFFLGEGLSPQKAWEATLDAYAYVHHTNDGRTPVARASEVILQYWANVEAQGDRE